jgi:hypothetical protein
VGGATGSSSTRLGGAIGGGGAQVGGTVGGDNAQVEVEARGAVALDWEREMVRGGCGGWWRPGRQS